MAPQDKPSLGEKTIFWQEGDASGKSKQSRNQKKSRKAMLKLGMKSITVVSRVTEENQQYIVRHLKAMSSRAQIQRHVIFGEAKIEYLSSQLQSQAAEQFKAPELSQMISSPEASGVEHDDDEGVEPKVIELVMTHAGISRSKVVRALKSANGDIVTAIMEVTI